MRTLFANIKALIQTHESHIKWIKGAEMAHLQTLEDAYLLVENGKIHSWGQMSENPLPQADQHLDVSGKMILPCYCDSHTHIVYAGSREGEFVDRINGLTYQQIAKRGGGILHSAKKLQDISEEALYAESSERLEEVIKLGTGAIEVKSGYGLTVESELKMLRVIRRLQENYPIPIKATLLAAHALPTAFKNNRKAYIQMIIDELVPLVAKEKLASFIDVFCEDGYFTVDDMHRILEAGAKYGLSPKIHVNQFNAIGGVAAGVSHGAKSVDHLEVLKDEDIDALAVSNTMPTALPGCSFFINIPYTPARKIMKAGLPLALASDYNPGSAPSGNMNFVLSTACIKMKMTPEEAINAATINGAYAMGLEHESGTITRGKRANLIVTKPISSYHMLPYAFGSNLIDQVYINGELWT